jgi:hypothetical protein
MIYTDKTETLYCIELQDANETGYCHTDMDGEAIWYDNLDEARIEAKCLLGEHIVLTRIFDDKDRLVDFFKA